MPKENKIRREREWSKGQKKRQEKKEERKING